MAKSNQHITLLELQEKIKETIEDSFLEMMWISASIAQVSIAPAGHCYITLTENDDEGMTARANAIIWASSYRVIKPYFESMAGEPLSEGMKILFRARVQYSELYGLSLIITDIDPAFTVGEAFLEKQKTIERLQKEGMMDLNSALELPLLPRRIAVVSAEGAAGYGDFMNHLHKNDFGFSFVTTLFTAPLQGKEAPAGIIAALEQIAARESEFDAVVIMRGGGSATDLACFDDYDLAINIAQFPLPVITAIGHERDYHIADMVAYRNVNTPTAGADFFLDILAGHLANINSLATRILMAIKGKKSEALGRIEMLRMRLSKAISDRVSEHERRLDLLQARIEALDPAAVLERGYSVVYKNGRKVLSATDLKPQDELTVLMKDGSVEVQVKRINLKDNG